MISTVRRGPWRRYGEIPQRSGDADSHSSESFSADNGRERTGGQAPIQLPWNPYGTRRGRLIRATGSPEKSEASMITRSLPSRAGS